MGFGEVTAGIVLGAAVGLIDVQVALLTLLLGLAVAATWGLGGPARSPSVPAWWPAHSLRWPSPASWGFEAVPW